MSDSFEIKKAKIDSLVTGFTNSGYKSTNRIGQTEILEFLNRRSSSGRFDEIISQNLFMKLNFGSISTISVEDFINGYLQFEEDVRKNAEMFNIKLAKEKEVYAKLAEECEKYKSEKLNSEGLCKDAKVYGEITEIDIKKKLEGIKGIIIKVVYNEKSEELHFKIGDINSNEMAHKSFEFKPESRKDHFEFIMKGINDKNQIFDIGSKVFPLTEVNSYEEYLVQIVIPEIDNEKEIAAHINAKIVLYWSDYKYYEKQRKKSESRLNKLTIATNKATEYLRKIREIYGDLTRKKPDLIVDFNNEKLMQRKGVKLNVNFNNVKESEGTGKYIVEFNNQKEIEIIQKKQETKRVEVEFNNAKEIEVKEPEKKEEEINNIEIGVEQEHQTEINNNLGYADVIFENGQKQEEYQTQQETTEQVNEEGYGTTTNYDEYQTVVYTPTENITGLENTEIVNETQIRNSVQEALIRRSLNKPLYSENTLPVKVLEKINKVIVDTNVRTLPAIYGKKKVIYVNNEDSAKYNYLNQEGATEINQDYTQNYTQDYSQGQDYTQNYTQSQDYTQAFQGQDYTQTQSYAQEIQVQDLTQGQGFGFDEYKTTTY